MINVYTDGSNNLQLDSFGIQFDSNFMDRKMGEGTCVFRTSLSFASFISLFLVLNT